MLIFSLLVYILACYGLSNMVVYSKGPIHMFESWRNWINEVWPAFGELFSCMMCFPFWAGVLFSILDLFIFPNMVFTPFAILMSLVPVTFWSVLAIIMLNGILSSGTTWILHNIEEFFENH